MQYGDLQTLREQIKRTTSKKSASDDHHVNDAIAKACRKYYRRAFRFNTTTISMALQGERTEQAQGDYLSLSLPEPPGPDVTTYFYPWDMLRHKRMSRVEWSPRRHLVEYSLTDLTANFPDELTGIPYGIAYDGKVMVVRPIVEPGYPVTFNYLQEVERPMVKFEDGKWLMINALTGEKMEDETTSPWFDEAQDLIHWAAVYSLSMGVYGDPERAQMAGPMELQALRDLERGDQMTSEPRAAKAHYR